MEEQRMVGTSFGHGQDPVIELRPFFPCLDL